MSLRQLGLLIALLGTPLLLQAEEPAIPGELRYEIRRDHDPNGMGKF